MDFTRIQKTALGDEVVYWVWFDEPQLDADPSEAAASTQLLSL